MQARALARLEEPVDRGGNWVDTFFHQVRAVLRGIQNAKLHFPFCKVRAPSCGVLMQTAESSMR